MDQNFDHRIIAGLLARLPELDFVFADAVALSTVDDPALLEWAWTHQRIVITHDAKTMPNYAFQRVAANKNMMGVLLVYASTPIRLAIETLVLVLECYEENDLKNQVIRIPL